jgi:cytochrome c5
MKIIFRFFFFITFVTMAMMQASQNGYSASGFLFNDSTIVNVNDSILSPSDSILVVKRILTEGKRLYEKKCQRCHELHSPKDYRLNKWKENLDEMKDKAELTKGEYRLILGYLEANCKK